MVMGGGRVCRGVLVATTGTEYPTAGGTSRRTSGGSTCGGRTCGAMIVVMAGTVRVDGLFGLVRFMTRGGTFESGHEGRARSACGGST